MAVDGDILLLDDSKSGSGNRVRVRFSPSAPNDLNHFEKTTNYSILSVSHWIYAVIYTYWPLYILVL